MTRPQPLPEPVPTSVYAQRDAFVAGRDQNFYGVDGPAFVVEAHVPRAVAPTRELARSVGQPSKLLTARRQVVAFTGRQDTLAAIEQWRDGPARRAAQLIHAPGGQGKTRLAARIADLAAAAGWVVGHARHRVETPTARRPLDIDGDVPLLVIVDYAERWPHQDRQRLLGHYGAHAGRLRILLLARSVGWWAALNADCDDLDIDTCDPWELPPLAASTTDRAVVFDAACRRFAEIYRHTYPLDEGLSWTVPGRASDRVYGLTLGLHMAALAVVDATARGGDPPRGSGDLSRYLLDRERRYWTHLHGEQATTTAARTVFIAALAGPLLPADGVALLAQTGLDAAAGASAQHLLDMHARCYPAAVDTVLEPLYPDRLAEDFIALTLPDNRPSAHADSWAANLVTTAHLDDDQATQHRPGPLFTRDSEQRPPSYTARALTFLAAAAGRHDHTAARLRTLLAADPALAIDGGGSALLAVTPHTDDALARAIIERLPKRSVELDPAAAELVIHLTTLTPTADPADRAWLQATLALRLSNAGRREEALAPAKEAVAIRRGLVEVNSVAFLPALAMSLNNLGICLSGLGRREEALTPVEEAVEIYRGLVEVNSVAFLPALAGSLSNLGMFLSELGRREEALAPAEEAVEIRRGLVEVNSVAFLPDLAMSLNNLGMLLSELGRREEALAPAKEAVEIYRGLVEVNSVAFLPDLATSLNNLGAFLSGLGRREEALTPAEEAVEIRRGLVEVNSVAFLPDLAMSLNNLGAFLSGLGRREEALAPTEEATGIYRRLVEVNSVAFLPDLAGSLNNLGMFLSGLGRREEALAPVEEAVEIYRGLVEVNSVAFLPDLAMSLNNLGAFLSELGRREEALAPVEEAVEIRRGLVEVNSVAFLPALATSLNNLGAFLSGLGRREEALAPTEEATGIYRRLVEVNSVAFLPDLAGSLNNLGIRLSGLGRREDALAPAKEAVEIRRGLVEVNSVAFLPDLAGSLNNLGAFLSELGRREEALAPVEDAVEIYRGLVEVNSVAFLPDLATSLWVFAWICVRVERNLPEALHAVAEAIDLYTALAEQLPQAFGGRLWSTYHTLADVLDRLGRTDEAAELRRQLDAATDEEDLNPA